MDDGASPPDAEPTRVGRADRILVSLHDLSPGGTERIAIRLANRWAALGRCTTLLCGVAAGELAPLIGGDVEVVACDPPVPRAPGSRRRLGQATARRLADAPADALFIPGNHHWPVIPEVSRRLGAARPAIVAQISNPLRRPDRGLLAQAVFDARARRRLRSADAAVSLSDVMTAESDRLLGRRITRCIPLPALDDDPPPPLPAPRGAAPLVLCAGRLVPQKAFEVALSAFARADVPDARLVILGEGPEREALQALAAALGVAPRVDMPGHVPDIRPWLDRCDLFLLTSRYEGYGAVVVEALAAGRPVVATACTPAAFELLGAAERGRVVPVGDVAAIVQAITHMLAQPASNPQALAAAVAEHRIGPAAQAYLDLFDSVCARRASAGSPRG